MEPIEEAAGESPRSHWSANPKKSGPCGAVACSQNARNLSTRASGALPAIKAALIAPMEIPETQSGCSRASTMAW
jgi:hypothetical protein